MLDLVATGFDKPSHLFGHTLRTAADVHAAADAFKEHYVAVSASTRRFSFSRRTLRVLEGAVQASTQASGVCVSLCLHFTCIMLMTCRLLLVVSVVLLSTQECHLLPPATNDSNDSTTAGSKAGSVISAGSSSGSPRRLSSRFIKGKNSGKQQSTVNSQQG